MPFQTTVNTLQAPAVAGDFCDHNPRSTVDAGPGGLIAGPSGAIVGRFCWMTGLKDPDGTPSQINNFGVGLVAGFIHREQQGLITAYLAEFGMTVPAGFPITVHNSGGFWVKNDGSTVARLDQKAFADYNNGQVSFAAAGGSPTTPLSAAFTGTIAAAPASFTGAIAGNILTVSAVTSGTLAAGMTVTGTGGGGVASGTKIVSQLSGTTGGVGTYATNLGSQSVTSTAMSGTVGLLTVSAVSQGVLEVGDVLASGTAVATGTVISQLGTGTGLTGTYYVDGSQNTTPALAITGTSAIETRWYAKSEGLPGELVKISTVAPG